MEIINFTFIATRLYRPAESRMDKSKENTLSDNQENQHQLPEQPDSNNDLADVLSNLSRIYNEEENNEEEKEEVEKEEVEKEVEKEEKEKEEEAEEVVVEEVVMLTSSDNRPIDQHSDDDHLEMDD
ncbi:unnamed protein product [Rhizophagus irregularis]|nr:unnamed protein product [Rhizophagus irregularis]